MYLLDTHILIWFIENSPKLPEFLRNLIGRSDDLNIYVSIASFWEMAIKVSKKKLTLIDSVQDIMRICSDELHFLILNIKAAHLKELEKLDFHHNDPFDRLIISQAIAENMTLISADKYIKAYPVKWLWQD
ncbi:MAG: type II toxin-antitoxin system VapC family toxin [Synergistaceae bacterium]|nr:type II toxin-antitoxin system VapC family toxin [Synergistaceae bacterium]MBQ9897434.1 type II toxin-antitoxin system VapC family toxin [Synergistaceae bacterium]MBR0045160.1 type II toxin-antitoxin system VapC family toxin [Synergistaceae bacterium]MBR0097125.1 type II toxin-antitoxin system VapC family toxin [Synergistaceae bacterium]MBR0221482.1 type II toxin-antitoxin system VapC family toxin [Synergistaceae bacterium]